MADSVVMTTLAAKPAAKKAVAGKALLRDKPTA